MRTFDEAWREELKMRIDSVCDGLSREYGIDIDNNFGSGYPSVYNAPLVAARAKEALGGIFEVMELGMRPTGEDFGYYTERYPSLFYRLGVGYAGEEAAAGKAGALHTPTLLPDTKAIGVGVLAMVLLVLDFQNLTFGR